MTEQNTVNTEWFAEYSAKKKESDYKSARTKAQTARDSALNAMVYTFADGRTVQVRPKDLSNYTVNIQLNEPDEWILADNSIAMLSVEEMQEAVNSGIVQGKAIWAAYKEKLKQLEEEYKTL